MPDGLSTARLFSSLIRFDWSTAAIFLSSLVRDWFLKLKSVAGLSFWRVSSLPSAFVVTVIIAFAFSAPSLRTRYSNRYRKSVRVASWTHEQPGCEKKTLKNTQYIRGPLCQPVLTTRRSTWCYLERESCGYSEDARKLIKQPSDTGAISDRRLCLLSVAQPITIRPSAPQDTIEPVN